MERSFDSQTKRKEFSLLFKINGFTFEMNVSLGYIISFDFKCKPLYLFSIVYFTFKSRLDTHV